MRQVCIFLAAMLIVLPVLAQDKPVICRMLPVQADNQSAAYKPGVDVYGRPVVPADLGAAVDPVPDIVKIPVTVDIAKRLPQPLPQGTELESGFGMIAVHKDGRVEWDGQDITGAIYGLCGADMPETLEKSEEETSHPKQNQHNEDDIIWGEGH